MTLGITWINAWPHGIKSYEKACPLEAALDVIGGKWKGIHHYHLFNGNLRFNMLHRAIPAITHRILTTKAART